MVQTFVFLYTCIEHIGIRRNKIGGSYKSLHQRKLPTGIYIVYVRAPMNNMSWYIIQSVPRSYRYLYNPLRSSSLSVSYVIAKQTYTTPMHTS